MSTTLATALINWNDLWNIIVAALTGGTGVAIVFGLLLLGISRGKTATNSLWALQPQRTLRRARRRGRVPRRVRHDTEILL